MRGFGETIVAISPPTNGAEKILGNKKKVKTKQFDQFSISFTKSQPVISFKEDLRLFDKYCIYEFDIRDNLFDKNIIRNTK